MWYRYLIRWFCTSGPMVWNINNRLKYSSLGVSKRSCFTISVQILHTPTDSSRLWRRQRMSSLILRLFGQCFLMCHWNWRCRTHFCSLSRSGAGEYCESHYYVSGLIYQTCRMKISFVGWLHLARPIFAILTFSYSFTHSFAYFSNLLTSPVGTGWNAEK